MIDVLNRMLRAKKNVNEMEKKDKRREKKKVNKKKCKLKFGNEMLIEMKGVI